MTELLTAAQMAAIERAAIEAGEVTGLELMERAGRGVVEAILDWRPELAANPYRAAVLCGPGNNGGDGFVVARLLHARGWAVDVFLYGRAPGEIDRLPPDAAANARRWAALGEIRPLDGECPLVSERHPSTDKLAWTTYDLAVDALFGAGLSRPLEGAPAEIARSTEVGDTLDLPVVAVDGPSGLCLDSGRALGGTAFVCDLTVSFHRLKLGHRFGEGPDHCGRVALVDIGLLRRRTEGAVADLAAGSRRLGADAWGVTRHLAKARPFAATHKYTHGHALVLAGGVGRGGAARLAARGALRVGAGLVTVGCPPAALIENAARLDAVMLRPVGDPEALAEALSDQRINALCLGPGLGAGEATRALVAAACGAGRATVLDADALTAFADDPGALWALTHPRCVLTPHRGEFGRLFPDLLATLEAPATRGPAYSKVDATREAAARAGCVVLFKGADTVIADPSGRAAINSAQHERAAPWLATAGAGDVLAGMIAGLLARGFEPMAAAETAAWLHVEAARRFGPGLIAEDIPEQLPGVFRDLGLGG